MNQQGTANIQKKEVKYFFRDWAVVLGVFLVPHRKELNLVSLENSKILNKNANYRAFNPAYSIDFGVLCYASIKNPFARKFKWISALLKN